MYSPCFCFSGFLLSVLEQFQMAAVKTKQPMFPVDESAVKKFVITKTKAGETTN